MSLDCGGFGPPPAGFKAAVRRTPSLHITTTVGTPFDCAFGARSDRIPAVWPLTYGHYSRGTGLLPALSAPYLPGRAMRPR